MAKVTPEKNQRVRPISDLGTGLPNGLPRGLVCVVDVDVAEGERDVSTALLFEWDARTV
jgi:hypothetical protein